jgi:ADP-ribose pyrophosphatase YjhB (NUDIX family)
MARSRDDRHPELARILVTSVRCIVAAPGGIVVGKNQREQHIWPGGRREPGERMADVVVGK